MAGFWHSYFLPENKEKNIVRKFQLSRMQFIYALDDGMSM
jgi:hypothetical protein